MTFEYDRTGKDRIKSNRTTNRIGYIVCVFAKKRGEKINFECLYVCMDRVLMYFSVSSKSFKMHLTFNYSKNSTNRIQWKFFFSFPTKMLQILSLLSYNYDYFYRIDRIRNTTKKKSLQASKKTIFSTHFQIKLLWQFIQLMIMMMKIEPKILKNVFSSLNRIDKIYIFSGILLFFFSISNNTHTERETNIIIWQFQIFHKFKVVDRLFSDMF